jgi:hypothetical protein
VAAIQLQYWYYFVSYYHLLDFTEPEMKPKKVEEHSQNKVKKKTEEDKKVMRK